MSPLYGRKILGDEEFDRQAAMEGGGRGLYGSKVITETVVPEPPPEEPASDIPTNVVDVLLFLKNHPDRAPDVLAAEEARARPRSTVMAKLEELGA